MAGPDLGSSLVSDAGPLIHLEELGCLDLLRDFAAVLVPNAVWSEVRRHRPSALRRRTVKLRRVMSPPDAAPQLVRLAQAFSLDIGELEALKLMWQFPRAVFLTDDAAARVVAEQLRYEVHGTIGVVVRALRQRQRTKRQVLNLLRSVPKKSSLFIEPRLLNSVVEQVKHS
jgi:predicted nucleic acid-binding protein